MQISLAFHEIISWIIAAVSVTLFIYERKKNNLTPFFMNLQGILKTCHAKAIYYFQVQQYYKNLDGQANAIDALRWQAVSNDFEALKQTVMGVMKAIEPNRDMPFDDRDYTSLNKEATTIPAPIERMDLKN